MEFSNSPRLNHGQAAGKPNSDRPALASPRPKDCTHTSFQSTCAADKPPGPGISLSNPTLRKDWRNEQYTPPFPHSTQVTTRNGLTLHNLRLTSHARNVQRLSRSCKQTPNSDSSVGSDHAHVRNAPDPKAPSESPEWHIERLQVIHQGMKFPHSGNSFLTSGQPSSKRTIRRQWLAVAQVPRNAPLRPGHGSLVVLQVRGSAPESASHGCVSPRNRPAFASCTSAGAKYHLFSSIHCVDRELTENPRAAATGGAEILKIPSFVRQYTIA